MSQLIDSGIPPAPDLDAVAQRYRDFESALNAGSPSAWLPTFRDWDALRRELDTWSSLTYVRFTQDTRDEQARRALDHRNEITPALTGFDIALKRRYVAAGGEPASSNHVWASTFSGCGKRISRRSIRSWKRTSSPSRR